ncbi:MAG: lysylphosphatidylglycerol synthase transmembrane domain-containing protein [Elusimicrobiota bacterium]
MSQKGRRFSKWIVMIGGIFLSIGILAYLILVHVSKLALIGSRINWRWAWLAAASAIGSYAMVGLALGQVLGMLGYFLSFAELMGIALVSTTVNYFISSAGASGFALKAHLLRKRNVPYGSTVTAAVLSSAILYIVLAVLLGQGFFYLFLHIRGTRIAIMESAMGLFVLLCAAVPISTLFFSYRIRSRIFQTVFGWINRAAYWFSKSEIPREEFQEFEIQLNAGLERARKSPGHLAMTIAYTCLDWLLAMTTLYFSFRAVGINLSVGHLTAGFSAGQAATLIPVLPGGLGAVEGSMAAVYQSLGLDWETALVAVFIYRIAYYVIPALASVFVFWGLKVSEPRFTAEALWAQNGREPSSTEHKFRPKA